MGQNWKLTLLSQKVESPPLGGLIDVLVTGVATTFQKLERQMYECFQILLCEHLFYQRDIYLYESWKKTPIDLDSWKKTRIALFL